MKLTIITALILAGCASTEVAQESEVANPRDESTANESTANESTANESTANESTANESTAVAESPQMEEPSDETISDELESEDELFDRRPDEQGSHDASEIYGQICVTCHGETGDGRGLETELFGFDTPAEEWTNGPTVDGILRTLEDGVHGSSMRAFPNYHDVDRVALAEYILDLREALKE